MARTGFVAEKEKVQISQMAQIFFLAVWDLAGRESIYGAISFLLQGWWGGVMLGGCLVGT